MKYLHTMVRVTDIDASLRFYRDALGLEELSRKDYPQGRYTLVFLAAPGDSSAQVELTHNWDPETYSGGRNFGHLAYAVADIYATCARLAEHGVTPEHDADRIISAVRESVAREPSRWPTVAEYRERVKQCEALGEYAMAEHIRTILVNEQEHQIDLATALGIEVPDASLARPGRKQR